MNDDEDDLSPIEPGDTADEAEAELVKACAAEPETDIGNGRRFRLRFGDLAAGTSWIALFVARVGWHVYDGRRWKEDEDGSMIRPLVHRMAEAIRREAHFLDGNADEAAAIQAGDVAAEALAALPKAKKGVPDKRKAEREALERTIGLAEAAAERVYARRAARLRHAKSSAGSSKLTNALAEAAPYVPCKVQDLNPAPYSINCLSGTIDFVCEEDEESDPDDPRQRWSAVLRPHNQADMITKLANANFDPSASRAVSAASPPVALAGRTKGSGARSGLRQKAELPDKEFRKFLQRVQPDPEMRAFLKRFCGYLLTGLTVEQVMLFFYGAGRNGKSTFVDMICHVLGDYAVTLSIDSFSGESRRSGAEATPDFARLPGARLVAASEPEANVRLKDALIKTVTGGEAMPVRRLHQDFFEFLPHFKIILSGNHKPRIDDDSDGIWRRVLLVPWSVQIPKNEVDRLLPQKLKREAEEVFAWMVEGAIDYLSCGLMIPQAVHAASQEYREESDPIGTFIRMACVVTGEAADEERPLDLFMAYEKFCDQEGVFKYNRATFEKRLAKASGRSFEGPDGTMKSFVKAKSGTTVYRGIRIKPEWVAAGTAGGGYGDVR